MINFNSKKVLLMLSLPVVLFLLMSCKGEAKKELVVSQKLLRLEGSFNGDSGDYSSLLLHLGLWLKLTSLVFD